MANLQLKGLRKSYGDVETLHGIDLDVGTGEVVTLKDVLAKVMA